MYRLFLLSDHGSMTDITYSTIRLSSGSRRWAVTRNGEVIRRTRLRSSAEGEADRLTEFLALTGRESAMATFYLTHKDSRP
jgi:hypothetical protein